MSLSWLARLPFRPASCCRARLISNDISAEIARIKNPSRGGQNLSSRHKRLENMVRGKEDQTRQINEFPGERTVVKQTPYAPTVKTFRGLVIPDEPKPPEPDGELHAIVHFLTC